MPLGGCLRWVGCESLFPSLSLSPLPLLLPFHQTLQSKQRTLPASITNPLPSPASSYPPSSASSSSSNSCPPSRNTGPTPHTMNPPSATGRTSRPRSASSAPAYPFSVPSSCVPRLTTVRPVALVVERRVRVVGLGEGDGVPIARISKMILRRGIRLTIRMRFRYRSLQASRKRSLRSNRRIFRSIIIFRKRWKVMRV